MRQSLLALAVLAAVPALAQEDDGIRRPQGTRLVQDSYVVAFKEGVAARPGQPGMNVPQHAVDLATRHGGTITHYYEHALQGFAVRMPEARARAMAKDPRVEWVQQEGEVWAVATQSPATWGLDRIDQRNLPLSNSYTYNYTGSGVHAYIIDTGIRATHAEFSGRMGAGTDKVDNDSNPDDCNGHGTHVAGTVGGTTYGVAKSVTLHGVRVLNCQGSGTTAQVVAGIDWVTANHVKPAVANMSLGGGADTAIDTAVNNSINAGVTYAIAAGNSNANACNYSPARVAAAITVGSTTNTDARSSFSNYGTCLDIFAPGSNITSAWIGSDTATNTISGTSMATPHVAGVVALYLHQNGHQAPSTVRDALVNASTTGVVTSPGTGSPNRLLYSLFGGSPPPPGDTTPPTTSITSPANGATVSGTVTISASASDNVGVARVEFLVDGSVVCTDTSSPYSCAWNTATVANGSHSLVSRAVDTSNNVGTSATVTVTVSNSGGSCPDGTYSGTLTGTGDFDYQPNGTYYYSGVSGTHRGTLTGPSSGADFDLYLYKWNSTFGWLLVAASESATSSETINYSGTAGYYMWEVYSYSGSGSYTFCLDKP